MMKKKLLASLLAFSMVFGLAACSQKAESSKSDTSTAAKTESSKKEDSSSAKTDSKKTEDNDKKAETSVQENQETKQTQQQKTQIQVFIDSDLEYVMNQLAKTYESAHPDVSINYNVDHSATLFTQIQEGTACDLYFTGIESQMESLKSSGLMASDAYANVAGDNLVVIKKKGSSLAVSNLEEFADAGSVALAGGNLPLGVYTRRAMVVSGMIMETDDLSTITAQEISEQLNGVIIQEKDSTDQILASVADGSCEVGCVLYSDLCGYEDSLDVVETLGNDYSGRIAYSIAQIKNDKASSEETAAATAFMDYIRGQEAASVFSQCHFSSIE